MTRAELITYMTRRVDALIGVPRQVRTNEAGDVWYTQNVRKILGNVVNYENITYVVLGDTGAESDRAYFFESAEIRFLNVQENTELRDKLLPIAPLPAAPIPDVPIRP